MNAPETAHVHHRLENVPVIRAVIFDMDGTLTAPVIDWREVRAAIGVPDEATIIDHINGLPQREAARAEALLKQAELAGTVGCALNDGAREALEAVRTRGLRTALVTNNHREAMHAVLDGHGLAFDAVFCRDDGPLKPAPDLILMALRALGARADQALSIGDGRYDLAACNAAGVRCVYLTHGDRRYDHEPSVATLAEFVALL